MAIDHTRTRIDELILPAGADKTHSVDGVDVTLIRWMLSLTPAERIEVLQRYIQSVEQLRDAEVSA
jgi:hypothetical protein